MGREHDLIEASRTGDLAVIQKILSIKQKKTGALGLQGVFDSLRRPTNQNCQDTNGDTPLHLAALNGHGEAVIFLLQCEASANIIDNKGCQPLHLAAWNGHAAICQDLLSHGPSYANVNEQNHDGETALLCAAQYGHTEVVTVLLEHSANCDIRNHRGESGLDLACQYGRQDTVWLLLDKRPNLSLEPVEDQTQTTSALHLASRNGHKAIVQLLIERGFYLNKKTEAGSALHEAALYGKEDVVQFLLEQGIDVYIKDSNDRNAIEVLSDHKSQKSLHIGDTILAHLERLGLSPTKPRPASTVSYLDANNRPVSVSDIYSTPLRVNKDRGRSRVESESSLTSSQLSCPQVPDYRGSRPLSDPIYDVPQPLAVIIPKGKSPVHSEGSLHSPHGSPGSIGSLGSSPGRSFRGDIPKKPPRKKIATHGIPAAPATTHNAPQLQINPQLSFKRDESSSLELLSTESSPKHPHSPKHSTQRKNLTNQSKHLLDTDYDEVAGGDNDDDEDDYVYDNNFGVTGGVVTSGNQGNQQAPVVTQTEAGLNNQVSRPLLPPLRPGSLMVQSQDTGDYVTLASISEYATVDYSTKKSHQGAPLRTVSLESGAKNTQVTEKVEKLKKDVDIATSARNKHDNNSEIVKETKSVKTEFDNRTYTTQENIGANLPVADKNSDFRTKTGANLPVIDKNSDSRTKTGANLPVIDKNSDSRTKTGANLPVVDKDSDSRTRTVETKRNTSFEDDPVIHVEIKSVVNLNKQEKNRDLEELTRTSKNKQDSKSQKPTLPSEIMKAVQGSPKMQQSSTKPGQNTHDPMVTEDNNNDGQGQVVPDTQVKDRPVSIVSTSSTNSSRPSSLTITHQLDGVPQNPLTPTGYQQPPTPDHPPPSPTTAAKGIHAKIQAEKRKSRDMETITESDLLEMSALPAKMTDSQTETDLDLESHEADPGSQGREDAGVRMRQKCETRELIGGELSDEEILTNGNDPFLGLTKGAIPFGERRVKSQIYENVIVHPIAKLKKRLSTPGASMSFDPTTFDPVLERDELMSRSGEGQVEAEVRGEKGQTKTSVDKVTKDTDSQTSGNTESNMGDNRDSMLGNMGDNRDSTLGSTSVSSSDDMSKSQHTDSTESEAVSHSQQDKQAVNTLIESQQTTQAHSDRKILIDSEMLSDSNILSDSAQVSSSSDKVHHKLSSSPHHNNKSSDSASDNTVKSAISTERGSDSKEKVGPGVTDNCVSQDSGVVRRGSSRSSKKLEDVMMSSMEENEEWAQIADIMESFGGTITRESIFVQDYEAKFTQMISDGSSTMHSVGDWLDSLELSQYENTFVANGYDDMEFMGSNVLEYTDLVELGITDENHITTILSDAASIQPLKYIGDSPAPLTVQDWLDSLNLPQYLQTFKLNGFSTIDRVKHVWELELNSVLDIATYGHRRRILASLRNPYTPVSSVGSGLDLSNSDVEADTSVYKDYTKTPPRNSQTLPSNRRLHKQPLATTNLQRSYSENDTVFDDDPDPYRPSENNNNGHALDLRPPNTTHSWRHRPEVLIKGCCNYNAQYLGSTLVKKLVGLESTKESICKMKKSTAGIGKIPTILLSISYKGVKFIDAKSKNVICEHEIGNIFCACQDGDNLNYFAYITKDLQAAKLYCHVFSVKNTDLATEIILTLGEAFEVAYQMALRDQRTQARGAGSAGGSTGGATGGQDGSARIKSTESEV